MLSSFQLCWFGWNRPFHFFKNKVWIWPVCTCFNKQWYIRFVLVSLWACFARNVYKSRFVSWARLNIIDCGVCFIKNFLVREISLFKVVLNWSLDMGRHERSLGWTENLSIIEKFKSSGQADCGFSISTWKSFNTQEMSEIYFSNQIGRTVLRKTLS